MLSRNDFPLKITLEQFSHKTKHYQYNYCYQQYGKTHKAQWKLRCTFLSSSSSSKSLGKTRFFLKYFEHKIQKYETQHSSSLITERFSTCTQFQYNTDQSLNPSLQKAQITVTGKPKLFFSSNVSFPLQNMT